MVQQRLFPLKHGDFKVSKTELTNLLDERYVGVSNVNGRIYWVSTPEPDDTLFQWEYEFLRESNEYIKAVAYSREVWMPDPEITKEKIYGWFHDDKADVKELESKHWVFPLAALIHGGIWLQLETDHFISDPGGWDSGYIGVVCVKRLPGLSTRTAKKRAREYVDTLNAINEGNAVRIMSMSPHDGVQEEEQVVMPSEKLPEIWQLYITRLKLVAPKLVDEPITKEVNNVSEL
jgi:hypothetical protein